MFLQLVGQVAATVASLLGAPVVADHIYLFISSEPYILDTGVPPRKLPYALLEVRGLTSSHFKVCFFNRYHFH